MLNQGTNLDLGNYMSQVQGDPNPILIYLVLLHERALRWLYLQLVSYPHVC
jgi:hypothetical protein